MNDLGRDHGCEQRHEQVQLRIKVSMNRDLELGWAVLHLMIMAWATMFGLGVGSLYGGAAAGRVCILVGVLVGAGLPAISPASRVISLLTVATVGLTVIPIPGIWPLGQLGILAPALIWYIAYGRHQHDGEAWIRWGTLDILSIVVIAAMAAVALPTWVVVMKPDLSQEIAMLPSLPVPVLVMAGVSFAVVNAILEELAFRGLLQGALHRSIDAAWLAIGLQAMAFGFMHWHGVPSGPMGAALAGVWAIFLGMARFRSKGLFTPIIAHIVADAVIFSIIVALA